jgi:AcrR family transcriptional regulator
MRAIAARAGVSVGSLYQYFPSKQALLVAVAERHVEVGLASLEVRLAAVRGGGVEEVVATLVDEALAAHRGQPRMHQHLEAALTGAQREALATRVEDALVPRLLEEARCAQVVVVGGASTVRLLYRACLAIIR